MGHHHVLLIAYPSQGSINPSLQFAKRLISMGTEVTYFSTVFAQHRMIKAASLPNSLNFEAFSDGYDDGFNFAKADGRQYLSELRRHGSIALRDVIQASADRGRPISCLVSSALFRWVAEVAREFHIPSALLLIQPASVFDIYYFYFHGYEDEIKNNSRDCDSNCAIQLPGLPLLKSHDLPSFVLPASESKFGFMLAEVKNQFDVLDEEERPKVLVNTFDALEPEALKAIEKYDMIGIGPLVPSAFLDGQDPSDTSFGGDLYQGGENYIEWLNSKPASSVVYVAFGSFLRLGKEQMEEIARGLLDSGKPFLWVIKPKENAEDEKEEDKFVVTEELKQKGMIVQWCSQLEVLAHPTLGCFVTHCGWNSTLESLACGVRVIAFPHWTDQGTNAKLLQDVWKTAVRVTPNENGLVESDEIKKCIDLVMDDEDTSLELKRNAKRWMDLAREATQEGGSSQKNLIQFLQDVGECHKM